MADVFGALDDDLRIYENKGKMLVNMDDVAAAVSTSEHPFRPDTLMCQLPFEPNTREDVDGSVWMLVADLMKMFNWYSPGASAEQALRIGGVRRGLQPKAPANKRAVARKHRWMIAHRQSYLCADCSVLLHPKAFEIDHVVELRDGGRDELSNLQALCSSCHAKKTRTR